MKLYRGQKYGDPIGEWWTTDREDARGYAMSRGGNRDWVVLETDVDGRWLRKFTFAGRDPQIGTTYRIPLAELRTVVFGVVITSGRIEVQSP